MLTNSANILNKLIKYLVSVRKQYFPPTWFIMIHVKASCDIIVIVSFVLFIVIQSVLWPIYIVLYWTFLLVHSYRIYNYVYQLGKTEVTPRDQFWQSQGEWPEFIYNITYRRAYINSFGVLYKILKVSKGATGISRNIFTKLLAYLKILLNVLLILLWNLITGTPWLIVSRSFQYSKAYWYLEGRSPFNCRIMRGKIINNYQMKELLPVINYRIYKTCSSVWNFNPNPASKLSNIKANLFNEKVQFPGKTECNESIAQVRQSVTRV